MVTFRLGLGHNQGHENGTCPLQHAVAAIVVAAIVVAVAAAVAATVAATVAAAVAAAVASAVAVSVMLSAVGVGVILQLGRGLGVAVGADANSIPGLGRGAGVTFHGTPSGGPGPVCKRGVQVWCAVSVVWLRAVRITYMMLDRVQTQGLQLQLIRKTKTSGR